MTPGHEINYTCSQDFETCMKEEVYTDNMIDRLEISIAAGMCPILIFEQYGISVLCEQNFSSADVLCI